jgi:glutamine synthetase
VCLYHMYILMLFQVFFILHFIFMTDAVQERSGSSSFMDLSYPELERLNLAIVEECAGSGAAYAMNNRIQDLESRTDVKAVMLCFSDLAGRLHFLDYDKKHLLSDPGNLTFDGSSIQGFTPQHNSDLRFEVDWTSFRFLPADVFGAGKVLMFANVLNQDGTYFENDFRSRLQTYLVGVKNSYGFTAYIAPEIEGFVFKNKHAEQVFNGATGFDLLTLGGYFHALPNDEFRNFIDKCAEVQRALGFRNEKDHPEVASSQFEINFRYDTPVQTADRALLYKLVCRQVAALMGHTASFLPKPIVDGNGSGMHTNMSLFKDGVNVFYSGNGASLSDTGVDFACGILQRANDLCLAFTSSVNAFRRLDPEMEAPNEIKMSDSDRGSMIRIPIGNEKSARVECRVVAPDCNPYLVYFTLLQAGIANVVADNDIRKAARDVLMPKSDGTFDILPSNIYDALDYFSGSEYMKELMGVGPFNSYLALKELDAARCPKLLGSSVKTLEVRMHHEVSTQFDRERF